MVLASFYMNKKSDSVLIGLSLEKGDIVSTTYRITDRVG